MFGNRKMSMRWEWKRSRGWVVWLCFGMWAFLVLWGLGVQADRDVRKEPSAGTRKVFHLRKQDFAVRWIPSGSFQRNKSSVRISRGFWMMESEVTQGQWKAFMLSNLSHFSSCGSNCPVEHVSWDDAREFADKLSKEQRLVPCKDKDAGIFRCKGWRLPTEAEWEYAARAGTTTAFHTGRCISTAQANYNGNAPLAGCPKGESRNKTIAVCSLARNAWGLCDAHGNVMEWTMDIYGSLAGLTAQDPLRGSNDDTSYRVMRGGAWSYDAKYVSFTARGYDPPEYRRNLLGFRLVRY